MSLVEPIRDDSGVGWPATWMGQHQQPLVYAGRSKRAAVDTGNFLAPRLYTRAMSCPTMIPITKAAPTAIRGWSRIRSAT